MTRLTDEELDELERRGIHADLARACAELRERRNLDRPRIPPAADHPGARYIDISTGIIWVAEDGRWVQLQPLGAYRRGIADSISRVKSRRAHYELTRGPGVMRTKPLVFAIIDELLVFLEALLERATSDDRETGKTTTL